MSVENMQALRPSVSAARCVGSGHRPLGGRRGHRLCHRALCGAFVPIPEHGDPLVVGMALNPLAARPAVQPGRAVPCQNNSAAGR